MIYQDIRFRVEDDIATLTLNRPDVMNSLTTQMRAEITHAVKAAADQARVLVITGKGRGFCAGQDLGDRTGGEVNLEATLKEEYEPLLRAIYESPIPVISAVNGPAAGAGANIALAADVVIAADSAYFLQAFARIGLIPDAGGTYWLPRNIGFARAMGASLFAEKIPARQAADWGLIWEAVPDEEFEARWQSRAKHLAAGPTAGFDKIRKAVRASFDNNLDQQLDLEASLQGEAGRSHDFKEGVTAFMEKRAPKFEGR